MSNSNIQSWGWMLQIIITYGYAFFSYFYNSVVNRTLGKEQIIETVNQKTEKYSKITLILTL